MGPCIDSQDLDSSDHSKMPINLPVPQDIKPQSLYQLLSDILRRAEDGTLSQSAVVITGASGDKYSIGVDNDGAPTVLAGATGLPTSDDIILTSSDGTKYRLGVDNDGAILTDPATVGIILTAPNGTRYLLGVNTDEALTTTPL